MLLDEGWLAEARRVPSPHYDCRPDDESPSLLVVHNISLPPGEFGGPWIDALFTGTIDPNAHPYFAGIAHLRVSAHCLIRRDGEIVQYVPFDKRAWQSWLARYQTPHQRLQSGIDAILHVLDWIPVRLAGVVYALLGHGEKALPAWFASLADMHTSQYQVLTRLAQFSLAREPHTDKVETPKAAVSMAKKTSFVVVVVIALLTIYGALV